MAVIINRLTGGNAYIDGTNFYGAIEECKLPDVNPVLAEHKSMAMIGKAEFTAGFDKMEATLKFNALSEAATLYCADFYTARTLTIRGSLEKYVADAGKVAEVPLVAILRGQFKKIPGLGLKQQDNPDTDTAFTVTGYELYVDGAELFSIDVLAMIYRVNGVDLLAARRANLGI